jgi:hypothetical protein
MEWRGRERKGGRGRGEGGEEGKGKEERKEGGEGKKGSYFMSSFPARVLSESGGDLPLSIPANLSSHTLCPTGAGSADSLPKFARIAAERVKQDAQIITTKRTKFINPFDPSKVHGELTAFHRRWIHTFPRDKSGLAFQAHHSLLREEDEVGDLDSLSTLSPSAVSTGGPRSWSEHGAEFRSLQQVGRRSQGVSMSSSFGETLVGSGDGHTRSRGESTKNMDTPKLDSNDDKLHSGSPQSSKSEPKPDLPTGVKATPPRGTPTFPWRKIVGHRHMSDSSTKAVEDFTSIRRTGVDWKSLTEPACLPVSVDFFPSKAKLEMDYYESPSNLVVDSYDNEVFDTTPSK